MSRVLKFDSLTVYELFNAVLMIGGFVFFTFWEAKSQYVAPYYFVIIPYAVIGWKNFIVELLKGQLFRGEKKDEG